MARSAPLALVHNARKHSCGGVPTPSEVCKTFYDQCHENKARINRYRIPTNRHIAILLVVLLDPLGTKNTYFETFFFKMSERVWLNVQGTYFLTTRETLTEQAPDGLLSMLLRHPDPQGETRNDIPVWFVNRDAGMFRWILYALNTGQLVDHTTVGVAKDVWDTEVDYYGLFQTPIVPEERKRQREERKQDAELSRKAKDHLERLEQERLKAVEMREKVYQVLLEHCMATANAEGATGWTLVTPNVDKGDHYNWSYPEKLRSLDLKFLNKYQKEIEEFSKRFGFLLKVFDYSKCSTRRKYDFYPASLTDLKYGHAELQVSMKRI
jgi:hypothetical protein